MEETPFITQRTIVKVGPNKELEVELPRLTLKKIMLVTGAVEKLVNVAKEKSPQLFELFSESDRSNLGIEVMKLVPSLLPVLLNEVTEVLALYTGKEKSWVEDNCDMEDLMAIATPFFQDILAQSRHLIGPLASLFPKNAVEISPPPSQT